MKEYDDTWVKYQTLNKNRECVCPVTLQVIQDIYIKNEYSPTPFSVHNLHSLFYIYKLNIFVIMMIPLLRRVYIFVKYQWTNP